MQTLREALALLKVGRAAQAKSLLAPLCRAQPDLAEAHRLLAFAHLGLKDVRSAEREFAVATRIDPRDPSLPACLGELAFNQRRFAEAEAAWRASLALDPHHLPAVIGLARMLNALGRPAEALAVTAPATGQAPTSIGADPRLLDAHAAALSGVGRHSDALEIRQAVAASNPAAHAAQQNLAAAFLDLGFHARASAAADRAIELGGDEPELHYLRGRACQGLDRFDAAELAYREALSRRAGYAEAARDLAQLIWMRTGDLDRALDPLDRAAAADAANPAPGLYRARLREFAGDGAGAYQDVTSLAHHFPDAAEVQLAAAKLAIEVDPRLACDHAEQARRLGAPRAKADTMLAAACIAMGDAERAVALLEPLRSRSPEDQGLLAFLATAWRMLGDPRYRELYDYERLVGCWTIDVPAGWPDLPAYLVSLAEELQALHVLSAHPVGQSLRHGTMAERNLFECDSPAIRAFSDAVAGPIRRHLQWLGHGADPVRGRAEGDYRMSGIWTVRLGHGGFHVDHVHPMGWLSSACYVQVPDSCASDRQGWLKFGEPGIRCEPALPPEHFVRPEPGRLVLFPSYMWHGTVPFAGSSPRLTVAFDLLPTCQEGVYKVS